MTNDETRTGVGSSFGLRISFVILVSSLDLPPIIRRDAFPVRADRLLGRAGHVVRRRVVRGARAARHPADDARYETRAAQRAVGQPRRPARQFLIDLHGANVVPPILRSALYLAAVVLFIYDWRVVWPKTWKYRQEYIDHADEPDVANPALDQFDHYQAESLRTLMIITCLLLGIILFSANIQPALMTTPPR
jgi:hypothetical protein